jgi:hypothetical protein
MYNKLFNTLEEYLAMPSDDGRIARKLLRQELKNLLDDAKTYAEVDAIALRAVAEKLPPKSTLALVFKDNLTDIATRLDGKE